jgi:hypothetical protein
MNEETKNGIIDDTTAQVPATSRPRAVMLRPVVSPAELIEYQKELSTLITTALVPETDYGTIPGTNKPSLYKAGAERINKAFGVYATYEILSREEDHDRTVKYTKKKKLGWDKDKREVLWEFTPGESVGFYSYTVICRPINSATGQVVGEGIGSCSTMESKYIDRPRDCENVVLKMAQKRALVAATLNTYALSDRFTQDMEDLSPEDRKAAETASHDDNARLDQGEPEDVLMTAGKHAGKKFSEIPREYLGWLSEKWNDAGIKKAAKAYLDRTKEQKPAPEPAKEPTPAPAPVPATGPQEGPTLNDPRQRTVLEIQAILLDLSPLAPMDALRDYAGYELMDDIPDDKLNEVKVKLQTKRDTRKAEKGKK